MIPRTRVLASIVVLLSLIFVGACGSDDDGESNDATPAPTEAAGAAAATTTATNQGSAPSGGDAGGSLTLGDEVIELVSARCFLEEQDVSGSPGKILLTGQAFGTNADGEELVLDFTRFDEDSNFTGDDILVDIGDFRSGDAQSYAANAELGTVQRDGNTLSASGLTFNNFDEGIEVMGSFVIKC